MTRSISCSKHQLVWNPRNDGTVVVDPVSTSPHNLVFVDLQTLNSIDITRLETTCTKTSSLYLDKYSDTELESVWTSLSRPKHVCLPKDFCVGFCKNRDF